MSRNKSGMSRRRFLGAAGAGAAGLVGAAMMGSGVASAMQGNGPTLTAIKHPTEGGYLRVAVPEENYGFFMPDQYVPGTDPPEPNPVHPTGIEADFARGIAAAIFGLTNTDDLDDMIIYYPSNSTERFKYLFDGGKDPKPADYVDVILRGCTHSIARDIYWTADASIPKAGYEFGVPYFYDGADVLVVKGLTTKPRIAVGEGTTTYDVITQPPYNEIFDVVVYDDSTAAREAFEIYREVDGYSSDRTILIGTQLKIAEAPSGDPLHGLDTEIYFSEREGRVLSREPLAACVREGDCHWKDVVNMVFLVLREAELKNVTKDNVLSGHFAQSPVYNKGGKITGYVDKYPDLLPDNPDWPRDIIRAVGNYSEIWKRNFDPYGSAYYILSRGQNALYTNDGLHYPHPSF